MKTKRRIYMGQSQLSAGTEISLRDVHAHYLHSVLRLKTADEVYLFNAGGEFKGTITESKKSDVRVQLLAQTRETLSPPRSPLTLSFAPLKKDRTDFLVEKASELGAHFLQPVFTDHTQSDRVNIERLQITAIEAAEQCDRLAAPQVLEPIKLQNYLQNLPGNALLFLAAESGEAMPIAAAFETAKDKIKTSDNIHFLIGPEGGFSDAEFESFNRYPHLHRLRLGPRLLRAETAAIAVLSAFQAILGDWQTK